MSTYFKQEELNNQQNSNSAPDNLFMKVSKYYSAINDKLQFFKTQRWMFIGVMALFYFIRIIMTNGIINIVN